MLPRTRVSIVSSTLSTCSNAITAPADTLAFAATISQNEKSTVIALCLSNTGDSASSRRRLTNALTEDAIQMFAAKCLCDDETNKHALNRPALAFLRRICIGARDSATWCTALQSEAIWSQNPSRHFTSPTRQPSALLASQLERAGATSIPGSHPWPTAASFAHRSLCTRSAAASSGSATQQEHTTPSFGLPLPPWTRLPNQAAGAGGPGAASTSDEEFNFIQVGRPARARQPNQPGREPHPKTSRQGPTPTPAASEAPHAAASSDPAAAAHDADSVTSSDAPATDSAQEDEEAAWAAGCTDRIPMVPPSQRLQRPLPPSVAAQLWCSAEGMAAGGALMRLPVGRGGVTRGLLAHIASRLETRELLRVYLLPSCDLEVRFVAWVLESALDCVVLKIKGRAITLYRESGLPRPPASYRDDDEAERAGAVLRAAGSPAAGSQGGAPVPEATPRFSRRQRQEGRSASAGRSAVRVDQLDEENGGEVDGPVAQLGGSEPDSERDGFEGDGRQAQTSDYSKIGPSGVGEPRGGEGEGDEAAAPAAAPGGVFTAPESLAARFRQSQRLRLRLR